MQTLGKLILASPEGDEQQFELSKASVTLGRGTENEIVLRDAKVSRAHARLEHEGTECFLVDLASANGTFVNGVRVERAKLAAGDTIRLGDRTLRYEISMPEFEPDFTVIDSAGDLETTFSRVTLATALNDTSRSRIAVHTPDDTWEVPLFSDRMTIGRHPSCELCLALPEVSRKHASVERQGESFVIQDLGSANGTWLGNHPIEKHSLKDGDTLRIGKARLVFKRGFTVDDLTTGDKPAPKAKLPRQLVVFVPGLMGSERWRGGAKVWPNVRYLFTNPEVYLLPEKEKLEPRGILNEMVVVPNLIKHEQYSRLGDFLVDSLGYTRGVDLLEFAYDWRQDVRQSARRLAEVIDQWPIRAPVIIIAHSLGCLVSRFYVERLGGKKKVSRLILLGGPHYGVPKALINILFSADLLPFGILGDRLRQVLATFPSAYQILPIYNCIYDQHGQPIDVFKDASWLAEAKRPLLRQARRFRRELGHRSSVPAVSIFGYGIKTVERLTVQRNRSGDWEKVDYTVAPNGDVTVPERSTVLKGSEIHPVQQYHGSLYVDNDVKMRLKMELTQDLSLNS